MSSAGQAGKSGRRVAAAVRAPCREPPCGNAEDAGQPIDLLSGESPLPTVAVAFGSAHGGGCGQPISSPSIACVHPLRRRRVLMFAPTTANCSAGISSTRRRRPAVMSSPARRHC